MTKPWWTHPAVWLEAFVVFNLAFLTVDIYVAHSMNQFGHAAEWIPFVFSIIATVVLVLAFPRTADERAKGARHWAGIVVGALSILVGVVGLMLHLESQFFARLTIESLVYTAPFVAPLSYAGLGFLLLLNRMVPYDQRAWCDWVLFLAAGGVLGNFVLALADHAQNGFFHWTEWIPVYGSAFMLGFLLVLLVQHVARSYILFAAGVAIVQAVIGVLGFFYHAQANLHGPSSSLWDNTVYGAPIFAPLLLPNLSLLIAIGLWQRWFVDSTGGQLEISHRESVPN